MKEFTQKHISPIKLIIAFFVLMSVFIWQSHAQSTHKAMLIQINSAIGPATADFFGRALKTPENEHAEVFILQMDTPGGLDKSMRDIIKNILTSPIPIVTFVAPSGARAASAGTYILYASHIAAMAPGTNLGAATPVSLIGDSSTPNPNEPPKGKKAEKNTAPTASDMDKKVKNDAVAYIEGLAELRGRNAEWAKKAVTEAASLPDSKALQMNVIDLIANDVTDLLKKIDGRTVTVAGKIVTLNTKDISVQTINPDWRTKFLTILTDPSVAYILLLIAVYGLFFEFANPGYVVPGIVGAIALLLALYALHLLPINYVGLALVLLGIAFMTAEAFIPSFGALGIGGVAAFILGSLLLIDAKLPGYGIAWQTIILMAAINAIFFFFVIGLALKARKRKIVSGREALIGSTTNITDEYSTYGTISLNGEHWKIKSETPLKTGDLVNVVKVEDLTLIVKVVNK